MDLVWIAGLTLFAASEKYVPFGETITSVNAFLMVATLGRVGDTGSIPVPPTIFPNGSDCYPLENLD